MNRNKELRREFDRSSKRLMELTYKETLSVEESAEMDRLHVRVAELAEYVDDHEDDSHWKQKEQIRSQRKSRHNYDFGDN